MNRPSRSRVACTFSALLFSSIASAADVPLKNAGFEEWEGLQPKYWGGAQMVAGAMDCEVRHEGKCSLRLSASQGAGKSFVQVNQSVPAAVAQGGMIRLSGWIKVAGHTSGQASLWMEVPEPAAGGAFDNMLRRSPTGYTDWQQFEITLPVATKAQMIYFGALFSGEGTAWFDDLRLEAISAGSAASTALPSSGAPAASAPQPAPQGDGIGSVPTTPIESLTSTSFNDLQFLKPLLKERRIVALGESSHGVAEFSKMKIRLIKFLHEQMGYNVVAFEAPMQPCERSERRASETGAERAMRDCLFQVWHTADNVALFEYIASENAAGRKMRVVGFDIQSGELSEGFEEELTRLGGPGGSVLAARIGEVEQQLAGKWRQLTDAKAKAVLPIYQAASKAIAARQTEPGLPPAVASRLGYLALQMRGREADLSSRMQSLTLPARVEARDAAMAENLEYLAANDLKEDKIIVWAHNFHMARQGTKDAATRQMGSRLAEAFGKSYYALGLVMGRGEGGMNNRARYTIPTQPAGTLEGMLSRADLKAGFVDLTVDPRISGNEWVAKPVITREWGTQPITIVPNLFYDGVLQIEVASYPPYL